MPNPNAIVSTTIRVDRQGTDAEVPRGGLTVELDGGRPVRLDPGDERSAGFARTLDSLAELGQPVYVEVDPETDAVTRLLIPVVTHVLTVTESGDGYDVELGSSHARHRVSRGTADAGDADDLAGRLRAARESGRPVIATFDDDRTIIDVRDAPSDRDWRLPPFPPPPRPEPKPGWLGRAQLVLAWFRCCFPWPWRWYGCVSQRRAREVFDALAATSCDPNAISSPCIPFRYPDNGCWARAHEMCRLMIAMGVSPRKVWIHHSPDGWLHVDTNNHPSCFVEWTWHVAPTICVRTWGWFTRQMVMDPALFAKPVSPGTWKGVQNDPNATLTYTDHDQYGPSGGTDPDYTNTNLELAYFRTQLQNRVNQVGPPPYANCP